MAFPLDFCIGFILAVTRTIVVEAAEPATNTISCVATDPKA
jgi:hypothetical protein